MTEKRIDLLKDFLNSFNETFENRPLMLGSAVEVNAMFYMVDQVEFILTYGRKMEFQKMSWNAFLIEKKLIKEAHNFLAEQLRKNPNDFDLLKTLRSDYKKWLESQEDVGV